MNELAPINVYMIQQNKSYLMSINNKTLQWITSIIKRFVRHRIIGKHMVGSMTVKFENHNDPPSVSSENLITAFKNKYY